MSQAVEAVQVLPKPGARNPDNPKEMWLLCTSGAACPKYPQGHYLTTTAPLKEKAAGYKRRCLDCAAAARWRRPDHRHPRLRTGILPLLDGSTALLSPDQRPPELVAKVQAKTACGICGRVHVVGISWGNESNGICEDCQPWLVLLLRRNQCIVESPARGEVYAKIRRVKKALKSKQAIPFKNSQMPFWYLARTCGESYRSRSKASSWGVYLAHYRHLILFFEDKAIGELGDRDLTALEEHLSGIPGSHGTRSPVTIQKTKETLRRILGYAVQRKWLPENPVGGGLIQRYVPTKSNRIMKVEEEDRLHAACVGEFAEYLAQLIYLADTGASHTVREGLAWPDVNFAEGWIKCSGGVIAMTSRLARARRELWERNGSPTAGLIWPPRPALKNIWGRLCGNAGVELLNLGDFRRTAAVRMKEAGKDSWYIASILGLSDPGFIRPLLEPGYA